MTQIQEPSTVTITTPKRRGRFPQRLVCALRGHKGEDVDVRVGWITADTKKATEDLIGHATRCGRCNRMTPRQFVVRVASPAYFDHWTLGL